VQHVVFLLVLIGRYLNSFDTETTRLSPNDYTFRVGINQILVGISRSPVAVLVHFNGRLLISVVGSKIENKFLITFSLFY